MDGWSTLLSPPNSAEANKFHDLCCFARLSNALYFSLLFSVVAKHTGPASHSIKFPSLQIAPSSVPITSMNIHGISAEELLRAPSTKARYETGALFVPPHNPALRDRSREQTAKVYMTRAITKSSNFGDNNVCPRSDFRFWKYMNNQQPHFPLLDLKAGRQEIRGILESEVTFNFMYFSLRTTRKWSKFLRYHLE